MGYVFLIILILVLLSLFRLFVICYYLLYVLLDSLIVCIFCSLIKFIWLAIHYLSILYFFFFFENIDCIFICSSISHFSTLFFSFIEFICRVLFVYLPIIYLFLISSFIYISLWERFADRVIYSRIYLAFIYYHNIYFSMSKRVTEKHQENGGKGMKKI